MTKEYINDPEAGQVSENEEVQNGIFESGGITEKNIQYIFAAAEMSFGRGENPVKEELLGLFVKDIDEKYRELMEGANNQEEREALMIKEKNSRLKEIYIAFRTASLNDERSKRDGLGDELCHSVKKLWEEMKKANPALTDDILRKINVENQIDINNGLRSEEKQGGL